MAPFPMPHLKDLREKYTYNITPFQAAMNASGRRHGGHHHIFSDDDDGDDEDLDAVNCFAFFPAQQGSAIKARGETLRHGEQKMKPLAAVVVYISPVILDS